MYWLHYRTRNNITEFKMQDPKSEFLVKISIDETEDQVARQREFTDKYVQEENIYRRYKNWWLGNGFTEHNWAWVMVGASFGFLWTGQMILYVIWGFFDWLPLW